MRPGTLAGTRILGKEIGADKEAKRQEELDFEATAILRGGVTIVLWRSPLPAAAETICIFPTKLTNPNFLLLALAGSKVQSL